MSDNQSKDNDKITKLSSSQSEQGRTKRGSHSVIIATGRWISSGSQNMEETCKTHGSAGTSSQSAHMRKRETMRQIQDKPLSCKAIDQTGSDRASIPCDDRKSKKRRRSQFESIPEVYCSKDNTGNNDEEMGVSKRITRSMSKTDLSTLKESTEGTNINEDVNPQEILIDKSISFTEQGNDEDDDDTSSGADYVEIIDEGEFRKLETNSEENVVDRNKIISAEEKDECRTKRADLEMNLGVASRTRSKTTTMIQNHTEVGEVPFDLSDKSSSSSDSGYDSSDNDFEVENSNCSDSTESCTNVPSAQNPMFTGNEEGTSYKRNRVPEDNAVIDTIPGGDGGVNVLQSKNQSVAAIRKRKKAVSSTRSKDEDCGNTTIDHAHGKPDATSSDIADHDKTEKLSEDDITGNQFQRKRGSSYDLFKRLADSVLERGPMLENEETNAVRKPTPEEQNQSPLPLKFRFEDEVPEQAEKTDYEKDMEGLFELGFGCTWEELDSFNFSEVDQEPEKSPVTETQVARCPRGQHEFIYQEDAGVVCKYCLHELVGPKDVMPEWAKITRRGSNRKRSPRKEDISEFDEYHLASSFNERAAFNSNTGTVWNIKSGVRESMYKHQQEGFEFLWMNLAGSVNLVELKSSDLSTEVGGCIISHAPGTGKTRLTIVFLETYLKLFPNCRPVIIAPASMLLTWEEEFKKWNFDFPFHNLNNLDLSSKENKTSLGLLAGAKRQNKDVTRIIKIYSWNIGGGILGISYSLFEKLTGEKYIKEKKNKGRRANIDNKTEDLRKILLEKPGLVVLDEGHTPRNQRSNIWNALLKLQTGKRVILSGTPFQNNFAELFNTLRLVRPAVADVLVQEKAFSGVITSKGSSSKRTSNAKCSLSASSFESMNSVVEKLKAAMSPFVHVHKGTILQESLPGLRDCVILLKPSALQKSLIDRLEGLKTTFEVEHQVALISVHPYLFKYLKSSEKERLRIQLDTVDASRLNPNDGVKTKFILELVRLSVAMHEKVLIFSQYIHPLELIKEQLSEAFTWTDGKQVLLMKGKLDQKQRQILINTFNDPLSEAKVMLASTRCCSEGISLVGASRVVLLDVVWNPSVERQAISRAYRIGQKKFVHTYHLMTSGTSEADKYCRQVEKERLSELVFCSSSNENKERSTSVIEDRILDEMVSHVKLKDMFEKIINQPKDTDLIRTFGLT